MIRQAAAEKWSILLRKSDSWRDIAAAHQRNGYCTEAVRVPVGWALQNPAVRVVVAHALPGLTPSIRVMEKYGFVLVGHGPMDDGMRTIRYEVTQRPCA
jgi:RimJ/RimL family protein N-acetyltransferase